MPYCTHYIAGVSVGAMAQPTAIAIVEQESNQDNEERDVTEIRLRHLERMPMDATYPDLAKKLRSILSGLEEKEQGDETDLLVDLTGTGKSIYTFLKEQSLDPIQVYITAGNGETEEEYGLWHVAKVELVGALQVLFQTDKFKVASGLDLVPEFTEELTNFRMKTKAISGADIESWREGKFDDLVFAVALATWRAQKEIPVHKSVTDDWNRKIAEWQKETAKCYI